MDYTNNYNLVKPAKGQKSWDILLNDNFDKIDNEIKNTNDKIGDISKLDSINVVDELEKHTSQLADIVTIDKLIHIYDKTVYKDVILNFKKNGSFNITGELILNNCKIISNNKICFTGTGIVRGTINDTKIPFELFDCWHNLQLSNQRTNYVENADLYVDALFGDDTNDGLTIETPIKTFSKMVDIINSSTTDMNVILRGGRYEIPSKVTINTTKNILIKANSNEKVQVTAPLKFFNSNSNVVDNYNGHIALNHSIGQAFIDLWDTFTGEPIEIANSKNLNGVNILNRNANLNVIIDATNKTSTILADSDVQQVLSSLTTEEIANSYIMVWNWYTTQFSKVYSYSNGNITYYGDGSNSTSNGYAYMLNKPAPYYLMNIKTCAKDNNFFTTSDKIYLPKGNGCYFTANKIDNLITINNSNITFQQIEFCYNTSTDSSMQKLLYDGTQESYAFIYSTNSNITISNCVFHDISTICASLYGGRSIIEYNNLFRIGNVGIRVDGDNSIVQYNTAKDTNKYNLQGCVFGIDGMGSIARYNKVDRCSYIAIATTTERNILIYRNVISNIGCNENGIFDESKAIMDGGAIYVYGNKTTNSSYTTEVYENVIYNCYGHYLYRGIFCDDGCRGMNIHDNLIFNIDGYSIDLRQVNNLSTLNNISKNIVSSPIRFEGLFGYSSNSIFGSDNIVTNKTVGQYTFVLNNVSQSQYIYIPSMTDKDCLVQSYSSFSNVGYTLSEFLKPYIRSTENISSIKNVEAQLNTILQGSAPWYGIRYTISTDKITRIGDSIGKEANARGGINDFDNIMPWAGMRRCNLADDGITVNAYYGDPNYKEDGSNGQVMVEVPAFYYQRYFENSDNIVTKISMQPLYGFKLHPWFYDTNGNPRSKAYFSAYEGSIYDTSAGVYLMNNEQVADFTAGTGDKLCSIAGAKPATGISQALNIVNCRILAQNRGSKWQQQYFTAVSAIQMLFIVEYASLNSQNAIGYGVILNSSSVVTGETSYLGNKSGMTVGTNGYISISYRGIENLWGNIMKWVDGINISNGFVYVSNKNGNFQSDIFTGQYIQVGELAHNNGYMSKPLLNNNFDYGFLPAEATGTSSSKYADYYWQSTGNKVARLGGAWSDSFWAGIFYWALDNSSSVYYNAAGARLVV